MSKAGTMAPPPVIVFSITGCRHCRAAKSLLKAKGVAYNDVNLDDNPARRAEVVQLSGGRKTVPQVTYKPLSTHTTLFAHTSFGASDLLRGQAHRRQRGTSTTGERGQAGWHACSTEGGG